METTILQIFILLTVQFIALIIMYGKIRTLLGEISFYASELRDTLSGKTEDKSKAEEPVSLNDESEWEIDKTYWYAYHKGPLLRVEEYSVSEMKDKGCSHRCHHYGPEHCGAKCQPKNRKDGKQVIFVKVEEK